MPLLYGERARTFERLQQEFLKTSTDHSLFTWRGPGTERGPFARSSAESRTCTDVTMGKEFSLEFLMTNRGLCITLPLMSSENGNVAALLDCQAPNGRRLAILLKEVRPNGCRRVRSAEDILKIDPSETIPEPKTFFIEAMTPRTVDQGCQTKLQDGYTFRVDFTSVLEQNFCLKDYHSPDDKFQWDVTCATEGLSCLALDCSGQYGGLLFERKEENTDEHFVVVSGLHKWKM